MHARVLEPKTSRAADAYDTNGLRTALGKPALIALFMLASYSPIAALAYT